MNALGRDIEEGEVVLIKNGMMKYLTEYEFLLRCEAGFGLTHALSGTCVMGRWVDGTEPDGIRTEGYDILCSCRPETWQCPCGKFQQVFWKRNDGARRDEETEELVAGQVCSCGRAFDEGAWTCCAPLEDCDE